MTCLLENIGDLTFIAIPYFLGIYIRHKAMPGPDSPTLKNQCLLGLLLFFVIQGAMFPVIKMALDDPEFPTLVTVFGLTMEQGFLVNESFTKYCLDRGVALGVLPSGKSVPVK